MAMTKKELAEMDALREARDLARSLRWPEYTAPAPMTEAEIRANLTYEIVRHGQKQHVCRGWFSNAYSGRVTLGASNGTNHTHDGEVPDTQQMGRMWRTKADAIRVMRIEKTIQVARELAKIDAMLAEAE